MNPFSLRTDAAPNNRIMAGGFKWINTYNYEARNLPEQCLLEIGRKLSDEVEILAGELGLDNAKLEEAREAKCPAMSVLKAWSKRPCTTVLVLYNILNKLNRQDAIDVLEKHISGNYPFCIWTPEYKVVTVFLKR